MPAMLRAIVDDLLARESDVVVVGSSASGEDSLLRARAEAADMLITEDGSQGDTACLSAVMSGPPLSIFAISTDGQGAAAVSLARRPVDFDPTSKATLADAIRRVARSR